MIWKVMTLLCLLTPLVMTVLGLVCWRFPPKGPTWVLGFRSRRARAGDESWAFAQEWTGKIWFTAGLIWLPLVCKYALTQQGLLLEDTMRTFLNLIGLELITVVAVGLIMRLVLFIGFDRFGRRRRRRKTARDYPDDPEDAAEEYPEDPIDGYPEDAAEEYPEESCDGEPETEYTQEPLPEEYLQTSFEESLPEE